MFFDKTLFVTQMFAQRGKNSYVQRSDGPGVWSFEFRHLTLLFCSERLRKNVKEMR